MAIATTCPNCKARFRLGDDLVGKKVKCQGCAHVFVVPSAAQAAAEPWTVAVPPKPKADAPPPEPDATLPLSKDDPHATGVTAPKVAVPPPGDDEDEDDEDDRVGKKKSSGPPPMSKSGSTRRERRDQPESGSNVAMISIVVVLLGFGLFACLACVVGGGYWMFAVRAPDKPGPIAGGDKAKPNPDGNKPGDLKKDDVKPPPPPPPPPPGGQNVAFGFDGTFRSDNVLNQFDAPDQFTKRKKVYNIHMTAGQWYQIDMISMDFDSYLYLYDDLNVLMANDDDGGGFPNARIIFRPNRTGFYRIHATHFGGGPVDGRFMLFVRRMANNFPVPPPGQKF